MTDTEKFTSGAMTMPKHSIRAALDHAAHCVRAIPTGWDEENLSHNVESNYPELSICECEAVARITLGGQHPLDRDHDRAMLGIH